MTKNKILPIFIPHGGCRHRCIFCDQRQITGVDKMPAAEELASLVAEGLDPETELAFYGGSFTALPKEIREAYLSFGANLKREGKIGALRLSTHPAYITPAIVTELEGYGVDTVELGIQSTDESVLGLARRGHGRKEIFEAARLLSASAMAWGAQLMVGLPGDSEEKALTSLRELLPYRPKTLRIYPVLVLRGTELAERTDRGEYTPLSLEKAVAVTAKMYALAVRNDVTVIRMGLQPTEEISSTGDALLAGPFHPAFGYLVRCYLKERQIRTLLERTGRKEGRLLGPREDLPLFFGDYRRNMDRLCRDYRLTVSEAPLKRDSVALAPLEKARKKEIIDELTEAEFLASFTENGK